MEKSNTFSKIVKRNGEICDFKAEKIEQAIFKATRATGQPDRKTAHALCTKVVEILSFNTPENQLPHVEQVQDTVELVLFQHGDLRLMKTYLLYRKQHEQIRNSKTLLTNIEVIDNYLSLSDWRVKESANSSYSLQGLNQHIATQITSNYWLSQLYPERISEAGRYTYTT